MNNIGLATPEIFLLCAICVILVGDLFVSEDRRPLAYALSQISLIITLFLTWNVAPASGDVSAFSGSFVMDKMSVVCKSWILIVSIGVFLYSRDYVNARKITNGEYYTLALSGVLGMMIMVSSSTMLTLYLGLELLSLSLYALVALNKKDARSSEAAMKYFVLGALASGALLYGISMVYGATGSLHFDAIAANLAGNEGSTAAVFGLAFVVVGIAFKFGAAPFHMWVPDVYDGAPTSVALYISAAPKIAAFALAVRFLVDGLITAHSSWQGMLIVLAVLSLVLGNIIAIAQVSFKRLLAYSTISHVGFILMGILAGTNEGYSAAMFYAITYAITSMGAFGILLAMDRMGVDINLLTDLRGLFRRSPVYAAVMMVLLISMTGVPPTVGFYAKLAVLKAVVSVDLTWLALIAVLMSVVGAFYYLRVIKYMFFDEPAEPTPVLAAFDVQVGLTLNGLAVVWFGIFPGMIMAACVAAFAG
jgi:NADH-quinone oxidoreductase subunit N